MQGAEGVPGAETGSFHHVVVRPAKEAVLSQRKLVPWNKLAAAGHAAKALNMVDFGAGAHHEVVLAETNVALGAFDAV